MSSQTQTFPCPFCGRRMGVGIDLLGKHVRCPHCKQVVLAPVTAGGAPAAGPPASPPVTPPAPPPPAAPQMMPPPPPPVMSQLPPMPEPVFNIQPKEAADSILSEPDESDDEVFGSQGFNRMPIPRLPDLAPSQPPPPYGAPPSYGPPPSYGAPQPYAPPPYVPPPAYNPPPPAAPVHVPQPYAPAPGGSPFTFEAKPPAAAPQPVPAPAPMPAPAAGPQGLHATALDVNPFGGFDGPPAHSPAPAQQTARPAVVAVPPPAPAPAPANPGNPWAGIEPVVAPAAQNGPVHQLQPAAGYPAPAQYPAPAPAYPQPFPAPAPAYPQPTSGSAFPAPPSSAAPQQVEEVSEPAPAKSTSRAPRAKPSAAAPSGGGAGFPKPVVYGLAGYAILMTLLALYGLFLKSGDAPAGHPFENIPDTFGEGDPASRKKVSLYRFKTDGPIPDKLRAEVASGKKIEVGQLEIEPVKVERRLLDMWKEDKSGKKSLGQSPNKALVLHLKIKNNSQDLYFCPVDPAFNRKNTQPLTRIVVPGKPEPFTQGLVDWPFTSGRQFEKEQENDLKPLGPGETREYCIYTATSDTKVIPAVTASKDPVLWRVQLRRGVTEFNGKNVPVTALIGVEFKGSDVKDS